MRRCERDPVKAATKRDRRKTSQPHQQPAVERKSARKPDSPVAVSGVRCSSTVAVRSRVARKKKAEVRRKTPANHTPLSQQTFQASHTLPPPSYSSRCQRGHITVNAFSIASARAPWHSKRWAGVTHAWFQLDAQNERVLPPLYMLLLWVVLCMFPHFPRALFQPLAWTTCALIWIARHGQTQREQASVSVACACKRPGCVGFAWQSVGPASLAVSPYRSATLVCVSAFPSVCWTAKIENFLTGYIAGDDRNGCSMQICSALIALDS